MASLKRKCPAASARPSALRLDHAAAQVLDLFDHLPQVFLFVKDRAGRFVKANRAELELHGCRRESEMLGRTDFDYHPPALAAQYVEEDRRVMASRKPLPNQVWLVLDHLRMPRWYVCTKLPVLNDAGAVIGIAGVMRPYDHTGPSPAQYSRLTPVMDFVLKRYGERIDITQMAALAHLSVSQLQRQFQKLFGMSPGDYLLKVRLLMARRRLEETNDPLGQIAAECGFYDQSHFNRALRDQAGLAPSAYRARFRR
jgi:AraC-like DNA-binding protein